MRGEMGKIASNGFIETKQAMPMDGCFSSHPLYIRLKIIDLCYFS